jgi:hypothetical protein
MVVEVSIEKICRSEGQLKWPKLLYRKVFLNYFDVESLRYCSVCHRLSQFVTLCTKKIRFASSHLELGLGSVKVLSAQPCVTTRSPVPVTRTCCKGHIRRLHTRYKLFGRFIFHYCSLFKIRYLIIVLGLTMPIRARSVSNSINSSSNPDLIPQLIAHQSIYSMIACAEATKLHLFSSLNLLGIAVAPFDWNI